MTILTNAVEAIQIGLEDFKSEDSRRAHSAIRNIFAGMLLLFKEKLSRMSPPETDEVLIKQIIMPSINEEGNVVFRGKGYKTVDIQQIKERFREFSIKVEWRVFDEISNLRNNIEHYYSIYSPSLINEVIAKSFKIIRDFCLDYLKEEPVDLFGIDSWNIFLETDEIYEIEKAESEKSLSKVDWTFKTLKSAVQYLRCPDCGSDLIHAGEKMKYNAEDVFPLDCKKCLQQFDLDDVLEDRLNEELSAEAYMAMTDGGDPPSTDCPDCGKDAYVFEEGCCLSCGYLGERKTCGVCGIELDLEDAYEGGLCSYHRWVSEKAND